MRSSAALALPGLVAQGVQQFQPGLRVERRRVGLLVRARVGRWEVGPAGLRELAEQFRTARRSIVITAGSIQLPPELRGEAAAFDLGLPSLEEIFAGVKQTLADLNRENHVPVTLDLASMQQVTKNLSGLPFAEAMRTLRRCVLAQGRADASLLDAVLDAKRAALRGDGLLESVRRDTSFVDIAGLLRLREWLMKRKSALSSEGQKFGLVPPKGILITGVQGCGKSLAAKSIAGDWEFELARLGAGALYDKFVGESERKLRKALDLAQKMAETKGEKEPEKK